MEEVWSQASLVQLIMVALMLPASLLALAYVRKRYRDLTAVRAGDIAVDMPWHLFLAVVFIVMATPMLPGLQTYAALVIPFVVVLGVIAAYASQGVNVEVLWIGEKLALSFVLKWVVIIYVAILLPIAVFIMTSTAVLTVFGFETSMQESVQQFLKLENIADLFYFVLYACIVAPVLEEIFFRGFLFPVLKAKVGKGLSYFGTALLLVLFMGICHRFYLYPF